MPWLSHSDFPQTPCPTAVSRTKGVSAVRRLPKINCILTHLGHVFFWLVVYGELKVMGNRNVYFFNDAFLITATSNVGNDNEKN